MATGSSDLSASDHLFHHLCSVCKKKEISTKASVYCDNCQDYYCDKCVDYHQIIPALNDHVLITAGDGGNLPSLPTSRCDEHTNFNIDMYCRDHDEVGCIKCILTKHCRQCTDFHDITDFVKDNTTIVTEFIQEVNKIETELKSRLGVFHQQHTFLHKRKKEIIDDIEATRDKLINVIREQTTYTIKHVETEYDKLINELKAKVTDLNNEIDKITKLLKKARFISCNVPEVFVLSKRSIEVISKAEEYINDMKHVDLSDQVTFDLDSLYKNVLDCKVPYTFKSALTFLKVYRFSKLKDINIGYRIMHLCCTDDGSIFFTDYNNNLHRVCYKTLDDKLVDKLQLPSRPCAVCCVSNTELAVGLGDRIQMIEITGQLKLTDSIKVDFYIRGLYHHDNIFYVTRYNSVYKYDRNGKLLKLYQLGNKFFSYIKNIVVHPRSNNIHVTDFDNGVISMNQEGHVLNVVKDTLSEPWGICVDQYGEVFVSDFGSNNIIHLNCISRCTRDVINEELDRPREICFDARGRLYINDHWHIKVFKVDELNK